MGIIKKLSESDEQPICLSKRHREDLKRLLARAINKNQILILSNIDGSNITSLLTRLSEKFSIPLSTLKLNAKILKKLKLVDWDKSTKLTELGKFIFEILRDELDDQ